MGDVSAHVKKPLTRSELGGLFERAAVARAHPVTSEGMSYGCVIGLRLPALPRLAELLPPREAGGVLWATLFRENEGFGIGLTHAGPLPIERIANAAASVLPAPSSSFVVDWNLAFNPVGTDRKTPREGAAAFVVLKAEEFFTGCRFGRGAPEQGTPGAVAGAFAAFLRSFGVGEEVRDAIEEGMLQDGVGPNRSALHRQGQVRWRTYAQRNGREVTGHGLTVLAPTDPDALAAAVRCAAVLRAAHYSFETLQVNLRVESEEAYAALRSVIASLGLTDWIVEVNGDFGYGPADLDALDAWVERYDVPVVAFPKAGALEESAVVVYVRHERGGGYHVTFEVGPTDADADDLVREIEEIVGPYEVGWDWD